MRRLAVIAASILLGACSVEPKGLDTCPEDWAAHQIASSYWGAPCPVPMRRTDGVCNYRDSCGEIVFVAGCVYDGAICEDKTAHVHAEFEPTVRIANEGE